MMGISVAPIIVYPGSPATKLSGVRCGVEGSAFFVMIELTNSLCDRF